MPASPVRWHELGARLSAARDALGLPTRRTQRIVGGTLAVACVACVVITYFSKKVLGLHYDDAYITFRYALNLARGDGLVFNAGERTDSASSLLFTLTLSLFYQLGVHDLEAAANVLGIAGLGWCVLTVFSSGVERTQSLFAAAVVASATALNAYISGWALSGMEVVPYAALVAAAADRIFLRQALDGVSALLVSLVALTRVEGVLLVAVWLALVALSAWHSERAARRNFAVQVAAVLGVCALFCAFKWAYYGTLLPDAYQLKRLVALYQPNPEELLTNWRDSSLVLLVLGAAGLFSLPRTLGGAGLLAYLALSVASLVRGPWAEHARYSAHLVPLVAMLACVPLARLLRQLPVLAVLATALLAFQTQRAFREALNFKSDYAAHQACRLKVGSYLDKKVRSEAAVVSSDIGAIAYAAPNTRFLDTVGLTSSAVARQRAQEANYDEIMRAVRPRFVADTCSGDCNSFDDYSASHWVDQQSYWIALLPPSRFAEDFEPAKPRFVCKSADGLKFGVTELVPRSRGLAAGALP